MIRYRHSLKFVLLWPSGLSASIYLLYLAHQQVELYPLIIPALLCFGGCVGSLFTPESPAQGIGIGVLIGLVPTVVMMLFFLVLLVIS